MVVRGWWLLIVGCLLVVDCWLFVGGCCWLLAQINSFNDLEAVFGALRKELR